MTAPQQQWSPQASPPQQYPTQYPQGQQPGYPQPAAAGYAQPQAAPGVPDYAQQGYPQPQQFQQPQPPQQFQAPQGYAGPPAGWGAPPAPQQPGWGAPTGWGAPPQPGWGPPPGQQPQQEVVNTSLADFYSQPATGWGPGLPWTDKPAGTTYTIKVARELTDADTDAQTDFNDKSKVARFRDGRVKTVLKIPGVVLSCPDPSVFPDGRAQWWCGGSERDELARAMAESGAEAGPPTKDAIITVTLTGHRKNRQGTWSRITHVQYTDPKTGQMSSPAGQAQQAPGAPQAFNPAQNYQQPGQQTAYQQPPAPQQQYQPQPPAQPQYQPPAPPQQQYQPQPQQQQYQPPQQYQGQPPTQPPAPPQQAQPQAQPPAQPQAQQPTGANPMPDMSPEQRAHYEQMTGQAAPAG